MKQSEEEPDSSAFPVFWPKSEEGDHIEISNQPTVKVRCKISEEVIYEHRNVEVLEVVKAMKNDLETSHDTWSNQRKSLTLYISSILS